MLPPKGVYLPISKLHSILAVANLLAHNNISQICYCGQISLLSAPVNCSFLTYVKKKKTRSIENKKIKNNWDMFRRKKLTNIEKKNVQIKKMLLI